ncbi:pyridoxal phosphate-dependent transferase [Chaetomidium leptoderma]|uniref:Pyridoxal phosphate-dependent transferase n=1 Tax=Chaetomidium leptoderma TaxID=669021 RepID=A0AAN7A2G2_9PEZI|nr:pyridoxal phosphate-dependent transferase [Chaetomidium leptoderma]
MPVKQITTALGHSIPPEAPHNITFHIPGWDTAKALRRGDPQLLSQLTSIYPRFGPWCEVRQLSNLLHPLLSLPPSHGLLLFTNPDVLPTTQHYSSSARHRKPEHLIPPDQLWFRAIDIPLTLPLPSEQLDGDQTGNGQIVRLYAVAYPLAHAPGAVGVWQNYGVGVSSRLAAALIPAVETGEGVEVLGWKGDGVGLGEVPAPTYLPLGEAHRGLKKRIAGLVGGGEEGGYPRGGKKVEEGDVWLYPTGMGAIYRLHRALVEVRGGGTVVVLGSVFHNTYHLFEEGEGGMKHFGRCDGESGVMEALEAWLEGEKVAGRRVGYVFVEFPSNPILVSVDLIRLREVADKYDVPVVIDDTIGSFCNIDVSPVADVIITSITKSLSGYANFHNEYFHADAAKLLSNSTSYHTRSQTLNHNALTLATYLHTHALSSPTTSPITAVLYPPFTNTHQNYTSVMLPPTKEFTPGYGCLLAVEFTSLPVAKAFYDSLSVYHGPHLGAHLTLAFPFNDAIWGTDPDAAAYLRTYGAKAEQVRVSVGLEGEGELVDTFKAALEVAERVRREEEEEEEGQSKTRV